MASASRTSSSARAVLMVAMLAATMGCRAPGRTALARLNTAFDRLAASPVTGTMTTAVELRVHAAKLTTTLGAATIALPMVFDARKSRAVVGATAIQPDIVYDGVATAVRIAQPAGAPPWLEVQSDLLPSSTTATDYVSTAPDQLASTAMVVFQPELVMRLGRGALAGSLRCKETGCASITGRASRDTAWRRLRPSAPAQRAAERGLARLGLTDDLADLQAQLSPEGYLSSLQIATHHTQDSGATLTVRVTLGIDAPATSPAPLPDVLVAGTDDMARVAQECTRLVTVKSGLPAGTPAGPLTGIIP